MTEQGNPAARFQVRGSFRISTRRWFVVYGDVLSGAVRPGMELHIRLNSQLSIDAPIAGVEFLDRGPTGFHIGLVFVLDEPLDLGTWQGLGLKDEILEIS